MTDWSVRNLVEIRWRRLPGLGTGTRPEQDESWEQIGIAVRVLAPGETFAMYHRENDQEDFLVLSGEGTLIVEGEERPLREWDYFHCAPNTTHSFVGGGDGPCVMVTLGLREGSIVYPRDDVALSHGAGVEEETDTPSVAYEPFPKWEDGRPASWDELPWNR